MTLGWLPGRLHRLLRVSSFFFLFYNFSCLCPASWATSATFARLLPFISISLLETYLGILPTLKWNTGIPHVGGVPLVPNLRNQFLPSLLPWPFMPNTAHHFLWLRSLRYFSLALPFAYPCIVSPQFIAPASLICLLAFILRVYSIATPAS